MKKIVISVMILWGLVFSLPAQEKPTEEITAKPSLAEGERDLKAKIEAIIKDLGSPDPAKKEAAFKALEEIGEPAEDPLEAVLQNTHAELVSQAKELLTRLALKSMGTDPAITKLKDKLETTVHDFHLVESSLIDHTDHLTQLYEIPFYYEPSAHEAAQEKKTLTLRGLPLKVSLKHLLAQFGLAYTFRSEGIWLVKSGALIKELRLVPPASVPELNKTVYGLLKRKIELPFQRPTPLAEVLDFIRESMPELNIIASREVDLKENLVPSLNNCSLQEVLSAMLRPRNLGYLVKEGVLVVTPYPKVLKGLFAKLEAIVGGKTELPTTWQIRYEVSGWPHDKPDQIMILAGNGKAQYACVEKTLGLNEYYRLKTSKEEIIRLLKTFLDNSLFTPEVSEINLTEDLFHSIIKVSCPSTSETEDTYEYHLWFPLTIDLIIPEEQKNIRKLQAIEKKLHQLINQIKQKGLRIKP